MTQLAVPRSSKNILNFTKVIRKSLGLENRLDFPILILLEHIIPAIDDEFSWEITDENMGNMYACYIPATNTLKIRESVYLGACSNNGRDRFTIAHEMGHYFLHKQGTVLMREDEKLKAYYDPEWQANTFASFLLMPPNLIVNMNKYEIANKCHTSILAADIANKKSQTL